MIYSSPIIVLRRNGKHKFKITTWDAGLYQIRMALNYAGLAQDELGKMNDSIKALRKTLIPRLYKYGFLSGDQELYEDEDEDTQYEQATML